MSACWRFNYQTPHVRRIVVRVPQEVHARAAALAQVKGKSLDAWAQEVLVQAASRPNLVAATHEKMGPEAVSSRTM